ncbi:unnamed protein product [Acanthoscelides obtectus]|uniref:DDE-1 domain-containing protein n=1 Tax=Acanthoscelides obtectus TaxID=200917 RepID=A0A9P0K2U6_ACAOB|nr:unnamed protein product [Acanthoscelides obtectus]CAK1648004.1 hypothetical protein AOBTE_LOCUS15495 [Acanthoscelides obtectus]
MSPNLAKRGPPNVIYHCCHNGWITEELFVILLHHFIFHAKPTKEQPVLPVTDNHKTHTSLTAYNVCKENGIIVVTLPPHTSHHLQPLDLTLFSSLKAAFNQECDNFLRSHRHEKITPYDIAAIFNNAYVKVANIAKGVTGFASAGIFPLDPEKFTEEDFAVRLEVEQRLNVIEDKDVAVGVALRDTSISGVEDSPTTARMDTDINKDLTPDHIDVGSLQNSPTMPCSDAGAQPQSKVVSFKSLCPTPQSKIAQITSR